MVKSIRELFESFLEEMPAGRATLKQGIDKSGNRFVEVCPHNPRAATIRALDDDGEYVLRLGRGTVVELTPTLDGQEKVVEICRAVAAGAFSENISLMFGEKLFVYGRVNLRGRPIRSLSGLPLIPCWRTLRYEPY